METLLFDFDGTLVDSVPVYTAAEIRILEENGVAYPENISEIVTPLGYQGTAEYFINDLKLDLTFEQVMALFGKYMVEAYTNDVPAKEYVIPVLKELKKQGKSLNILTASPHITVDPCLKRLGIFDLFDNIWSADEFGTTKTDPEIFVRAAARLGRKPEEVLHFDDSLSAAQTAMKAGMVVCGVYDALWDKDTRQLKDTADYYISDFSELLNLDCFATDK